MTFGLIKYNDNLKKNKKKKIIKIYIKGDEIFIISEIHLIKTEFIVFCNVNSGGEGKLG